jgi:hypothetical protein
MISMRACFLAAGLASMAFTVPAHAQNDQVQFGPVPTWVMASEAAPVPADATGAVFVRRQDVLVHLTENGQLTYQGQHMKVLHQQALEVGNFGLTWNPAAGAPTVHKLAIHRDGQAIDVLANARFEILRREDQLEQSMLNGMLTAVLRIPDLRVGDEVEWEFTIPSHDPTLQENSYGLLMLGPVPPPGRFRLGLSWEDGQTPAFRLTDDLEPLAARTQNALVINVDDPPMLAPPKDAPPRYSWQRLIEYSDFPSWPAVSKKFAPLYTSASSLSADSPLKAEAARIANAHPGKLERAEAALELVQQQVRYIYVGLDGGNFRPSSAEETWQRRYGDCKGKSVLLLALLHELGVSAEAVIVNNSGLDDGFDTRLPNPGVFDHVLVRANIDGQTYWLDATLPPVAEATPEPLVPYRWALPLTEAGNDLERLEWRPYSLPQEMGLYEIDARAGFDEPARLVTTTVKRGMPALVEYVQLSAVTPAQLTAAFSNAKAGGSEWTTIENVAYRFDRKTGASILTITGTGPVDWEDDGDGEYGLALPGGGFYPPERRQRTSEGDPTVPFYTDPIFSCYAATLRLPEGTPLKNWGFNSTIDKMIYGRIFYRMMERRDDRTIRMVRGSRVEAREISAEWARRDNARLKDFDNSMANVTYDPSREMKLYGKLTKVPATYELDWTGADAPCLPDDVADGPRQIIQVRIADD